MSTKIMIIRAISQWNMFDFFSLSFVFFSRLYRRPHPHHNHHHYRCHLFLYLVICVWLKKSVKLCEKSCCTLIPCHNSLNCVTSLVWIYLFDSEIIRARQCHYNVNNVFCVKWFSFKINHHSHYHSIFFLISFYKV